MKKLRNVFADLMLEIGEIDPKLIVMVGDISHGILQPCAQKCPGRYFNVGICEPTIMGMAAGMSKSGLIPVVHTIAPFIIERAYEQIKLDFGYHKLGVNLVSVGSAFDYSQLGCSHHCYTDLSLMSHFKNARVFFPASAVELTCLFKENYDSGTINYFRLPEQSHGVEFTLDKIETGKAICVREGTDVTIVAIGPILRNAIEACENLKKKGISVELLYYHTIKPFDSIAVQKSVAKTKHVLVIEEASAHDGVFNLVARACLGLNDVQYQQIAVEDFIHEYGSYEDLLEVVGLDRANIERTILSKFNLLTALKAYDCSKTVV